MDRERSDSCADRPSPTAAASARRPHHESSPSAWTAGANWSRATRVPARTHRAPRQAHPVRARFALRHRALAPADNPRTERPPSPAEGPTNTGPTTPAGPEESRCHGTCPHPPQLTHSPPRPTQEQVAGQGPFRQRPPGQAPLPREARTRAPLAIRQPSSADSHRPP